MKSPEEKVKSSIEKHHYLSSQLKERIAQIIDKKTYLFQVAKASLDGRNPLQLMDRGFAVIEKNHVLITSIKSIQKGDTVDVKFKDGRFEAQVMDIKEKNDGKENI